ncbi:MAG: malonate decarboxylase subunit epsilon [Ignavibacteriota bacterium]
MSIAYLFPGQGAQAPGMLHALPHHPAVARTLSEVSEILRRDILELDTAEALRSTVSVQLALLTAGVAVARALVEESVAPLAVAGLSAGAFSAAVAAGVFGLADAVRLVKQRAEMMTRLFPRGYGLGAIVGLREQQVAILVEEARSRDTQIYISNINAPLQIVIAGSDEAIDRVLASASKNGAQKAERLDVAVPSHCPLLQPVADALQVSLRAVQLQPPKALYIANITGRPLRSAEAIAEDVAGNIARAVRWYDATTVLNELGCRLFLEMPPGHILSDLARAAFPEARVLAIADASLDDARLLASRHELD